METRWMKRKNEDGEIEKFYPITHAKAIVGLNLEDLEGLEGVEGSVSTEAASEVSGTTPDIDPAIINLVNDYLPIKGGTITGYNLHLNNGGSRWYSGSDGTQLEHIDEVDGVKKKTVLWLRPDSVDLKDSIRMFKNNNGTITTYNLYGEHNKPTAEDVGAISLVKDVRTENTDLNDYTETGFYYFPSNCTPANIPVGVNGWLLVLNSYQGNIKQYWWRMGTPDSNDTQQYTRTKGGDTWSAWSTHFLPLSGGTLSGELFIAGGYGRLVSNSEALQLENRNVIGDTSNRRMLYLRSSQAHELINALVLGDLVGGTQKTYNVYGGHNKPTGSYSGTGSATARTIDTKGLGGAILVYSNSGWSALVGYYGAICFGGGNTSLQYTAAKFQNGVLTLATTETALNRSGTTYYYQVL